MRWISGMPNFIGPYTYYADLNNGIDRLPWNAGGFQGLKQYVWNEARQKVTDIVGSLSGLDSIKKANTFLEQVAKNERAKELAFFQAFKDRLTDVIPPALMKDMEKYTDDPSVIEQDLLTFYTNLTSVLNRAKRESDDYLNDLKRIKKNVKDLTRTLQNYKADDYRYRLSGDISSFLRRLTGHFNVSVEKKAQEQIGNEFAVRVQGMAMKILDKLGLVQKITSNEDFTAIAASLLIQLEAEIQKEVDKTLLAGTRKTLDEDIDDILEKVMDRYTKLANKSRMAETPLDRALLDIQNLDFKYVTENAKKILNIESDFSQNQKKVNAAVKARETRLRNNQGVKRNQEILEMRDTLKKNTQLSDDMNFIKFSISGSQNSKHGNIYELIMSLFQNGSKVSGNAATDIITFMFSGTAQVDQPLLHDLIDKIGDTFTQAINAQTPEKEDTAVRNTKTLMEDMNREIQRLIQETENSLTEQQKLDLGQIFIFHESLKLYSSAETGRNKHGGGFGGRNISIISYIDDLYTMSSSMPFPITRDDMVFLALNLGPRTAGAEKKEPLQDYLAKYAGMVMFDDMMNMAEEATGQLESTTISQIHLYNLNGIYVPASMILSYVSEAATNTTTMIESGYGATATISPSSASKAYAKYTEDRLAPPPPKYLTQELWEQVAAENGRETKIAIHFLVAFKDFIEKLI